MTNKQTILLSLLSIVITLPAMAIPANPRAQRVVMDNGEEVTMYQRGDESFHWKENANGEWLKELPDGRYTRTQPVEPNTIGDRKAFMRAPENMQTESPLNIAPRGLVILVSFKDVAFSVDVEDVKNMISADKYYREYKADRKTVVSDGSARQYFIAQSMGQYKPQFDVVGPYTLSQNQRYYGENDIYGQDMHADSMIVEACLLADTDGVDFTQYDNNHDGELDFVYVIYAGYGENDGGASYTIWPHTYWLKEYYYKQKGHEQVFLDGKLLNTYACGNEKDYSTKERTGIGTFCHEFSHVLGLPDLYSTDNNKTHKTLGDWDELDGGAYNNYSNTPPAYSAYERFFMGWMTPKVVSCKSQTITIDELQASNSAYIICEGGKHNLIGNDPNPTTFWILENRQRYNWDTFIPGHGMMLTKINYNYSRWEGNTVNSLAAKMGVDLIEADGSAPKAGYNGHDGKAGDLFPAGGTTYDNIPNFIITDVRENGETIEVDIVYGTEAIENVTDAPAIRKEFRNGLLYIHINEATYDLNGKKQ